MNFLLLSDIDIATRTVCREAGGESYEGKRGVAHVLVNRWKSTKGQFAKDDTLATACLRHLQFSVWNEADINFKKLFEATYSQPVMIESMRAVLDVLSGMDDITNGALHYHAKSVSPYWAHGHEPSAEHGGHVFFNDVR